jgi:TRAP-type C4-dicarboxylate transport system permease small subunit
MTSTDSISSALQIGPELSPQETAFNRMLSKWMIPLEVVCAALMLSIVVMLFSGVMARYVFSRPLGWIDEAVSLAFIWVAMLGAVLAMHRNEHLRLSMFVDRMPEKLRGIVHAFALVAISAFLVGLIGPSIEHIESEWIVNSPALEIPSGVRVSAIAAGMILMLAVIAAYALKTVSKINLLIASVGIGAFVAICHALTPNLSHCLLYTSDAADDCCRV